MKKYYLLSSYSFANTKRLGFIFLFFLTSSLALGSSLFALSSYTKLNRSSFEIIENKLTPNPRVSGVQVYASLPLTSPTIDGEIIEADARSEMIRQYLVYYNSPLAPFAETIVKSADEYGLDYRLTTAIAQQESNLCKIIPAESFNCWGWGIHSQGTLGFSSYSEGVEAVTRGIKVNYVDKGLNTVDDIMEKYTPLSQGSWAFGVNKFMNQMR